MIYGIFVLAAFWAAIVRLWVVDGPRIPLVFAALWVAGFFGLTYLGVSGLYFVVSEAVMAAILLIIPNAKPVFD